MKCLHVPLKLVFEAIYGCIKNYKYPNISVSRWCIKTYYSKIFISHLNTTFMKWWLHIFENKDYEFNGTMLRFSYHLIFPYNLCDVLSNEETITYDTITELIRYTKLYLLTSITFKWKFVVIVDWRIRKSKHNINA